MFAERCGSGYILNFGISQMVDRYNKMKNFSDY
jgi:hypothetical protein